MIADQKRPMPDDAAPDRPGPALVGIDANVLLSAGRDLDRLLSLASAGRVALKVGAGVRDELLRAPARVPGSVLDLVTTFPPRAARPLTAAEHLSRIRVRAIVCGNARVGKHDADAAHLSEAAEAGCSHMITHDGRILRRSADLNTVAFGGRMLVTTLAAFLERFRRGDREEDGS